MLRALLLLQLACSAQMKQQELDHEELLAKLEIVVAQLDSQQGEPRPQAGGTGGKPARYSAMGVEYAEQRQFFQATGSWQLAAGSWQLAARRLNWTEAFSRA
jgi:hypothetical protein